MLTPGCMRTQPSSLGTLLALPSSLPKGGKDIGGGSSDVMGSFNVEKYNPACTKENMIGILEKSIYELLHNNMDTPALKFFRENFRGPQRLF